MADRRIDPSLLLAEGALISWLGVARSHPPDDRGLEGAERARTVLALHWHVASRLGLPAGPFQVWRRSPVEAGRDATITSLVTDASNTTLTLAEPVIRGVLTVSGGGTVLAFRPGPAGVGLLLDGAVVPAGGGTPSRCLRWSGRCWPTPTT